MRFNLLEINLSTREKKVHDVTEDIRKYLGGRGYGAKLLWDRVPHGADPYSCHNIIKKFLLNGKGLKSNMTCEILKENAS